MIHRFRSMKVPGGGLFNYYYLFYFIVVVLCIDKLSNVTEKLGCIIVVMAKNVSSICNRLSKESTCVRILEWDKQGERSVQRLLLRLSIVYLSDTLYPINTRPPYLPIAVVAVSRLFFFSLRVKCVHLSVIPFVRLHFRIAVRAINGKFPISPMNKECAWLSYCNSLKQLWNWNL